MEDLKADWETIQHILEGIDGFDPKAVRKYYEVGPAKAGLHFFLIRYAPGEVIVAKGTTSDYAAVHVQGRVRVCDVVPPAPAPGRGCWENPLRRRLENLVQNHARSNGHARGIFGWLSRPLAHVYWRLPGVPLLLIDLIADQASPRLAKAFEGHVGRVLDGRFQPVTRPEREASRPSRTVSADGAGQSYSERILSIRDEQDRPLDIEDRFLGIASTLWNQVRPSTLVADNDPADEHKPCVMLLIKRKALEEIVKKNPAFYERQMIDFNDRVLPEILARNRMFRDRLFVDDVADWKTLAMRLQGTIGGPAPAFLAAFRSRLGGKLNAWLRTVGKNELDASDRWYLIEEINKLLNRHNLFPDSPWPAGSLGREADELIHRTRSTLNECESYRLNRLFLEACLPNAFLGSPTPCPLTNEDFEAFTREVSRAHVKKFGSVLKPDRLETRKRQTGQKGSVVFKQGQPADSVYLILTGMVRVNMNLPGGRTMVNNLEADAYFGESAVLDYVSNGRPRPTRSADVETLCHTTLLQLDREVLLPLLAGPYRALGEKLKRERHMFAQRDEQVRSGRLLPPHEPPLEIAERIVLTRNVLLIDMDQCTRCDQCVRGCAEAHEGQARFHRANPDLRFGKWEIAGACLHCLDSPCLQVCPVGAITLLDDMAVQIHRDRCIGCSLCAVDCPFGVIDMYAPTSPLDAPSSKKNLVANKCDLCLTEDRDPPCVASCPYDAAHRVDPLEFFVDLKSWGAFAIKQGTS